MYVFFLFQHSRRDCFLVGHSRILLQGRSVSHQFGARFDVEIDLRPGLHPAPFSHSIASEHACNPVAAERTAQSPRSSSSLGSQRTRRPGSGPFNTEYRRKITRRQHDCCPVQQLHDSFLRHWRQHLLQKQSCFRASHHTSNGLPAYVYSAGISGILSPV